MLADPRASETVPPALDAAAFEAKARLLWESLGGDPARRAFLWRALGALADLPLPDDVLYSGLAAPTNQDLLAAWVRADGARGRSAPSADAPEVALARLLEEGSAARAAWAGADALRSEEVAERLGITRQAVNVRRQEHKLLAISEGRSYRYPVWQIVDGAVLPGLERVLHELASVPAIMALQFFQAPRVELDERSPLGVLTEAASLPARQQADAHDAVVRAARLFGEQAGG